MELCSCALVCFYLSTKWTKPAVNLLVLSCLFSGGEPHVCREIGRVKVCTGKWKVEQWEQVGRLETRLRC